MDQLSRYNIPAVYFALVGFLHIVDVGTKDVQKLGMGV